MVEERHRPSVVYGAHRIPPGWLVVNAERIFRFTSRANAHDPGGKIALVPQLVAKRERTPKKAGDFRARYCDRTAR